MACPEGARFTSEMFQTAMEGFGLWDALYCTYATPLGTLLVGTVVYSGFGLNIFLRTGSLIIPFVLLMILGGTVLSQMLGIVGTFAGLIILTVAPLVLTGLVMMLDRR